MTPIPSVELCCPQVSITLTKLFSHPWNHYPLFMPREVLCDVMMDITVLAWEPDESRCHSPGRAEKWAGWLVMRLLVPRTCYFSKLSIGSYPWCDGHNGNTTSLLPYDHGRLVLMRPSILHLGYHIIVSNRIDIFFSSFFSCSTSLFMYRGWFNTP